MFDYTFYFLDIPNLRQTPKSDQRLISFLEYSFFDYRFFDYHSFFIYTYAPHTYSLLYTHTLHIYTHFTQKLMSSYTSLFLYLLTNK